MMTKTMKVEGPLHVVCQCDKCKEQQEQELVGWIDSKGNMLCVKINESCRPLYTHPPQRTWVGLTDEEIAEVAVKTQDGISPRDDTLRFAIAIEAKLKEKNT